MNWAHLTTAAWLRWRLTVNQFSRAGTGGAIVATVVTVLAGAAALALLIVGFAVGSLVLRTESAAVVMLAWDIAIAGFAMIWLAGLIGELQRADAISLDRFLHLPVSPGGAFLINYVGSTITFGTILALPAMAGLAAGLVASRGPRMLVLFPLVAMFFLMMTAVTYQFRGWLASMMASPRRRRTIAAVVPILFILAFQLPNLWFQLGPDARERRAARRVAAALRDDLNAGRITREEFERRRPAPPAAAPEDGEDTGRLANMILPPGWLAYGAAAAVEGRTWPPLAGMLGMGLIGALSLRRAYGTTLRIYTGDFDKRRRRAAAAVPAVAAGSRPVRASTALVEARIPWTSERVSAVAVAGFRSWTRAPEMKMTLLTPLMMLVLFTGMLAGGSDPAPEIMRPLSAASLAAFLLMIGMVGPVGNQFGYDRGGFRSFVLSPIPRRDVLVGKNLSLVPFALVTMVPGVALSHWSSPMRYDHLLGVLVHMVTLYLVFCLAANALSIIGPLALKPGSSVPAPHQGMRGVYSFLFMLLVTLPLGLTLMPLGIEALLWAMDWYPWFPAYLVFGIVQAAVAWPLYRLVVGWQGDLLRRREQQILEIVGTKAE